LPFSPLVCSLHLSLCLRVPVAFLAFLVPLSGGQAPGGAPQIAATSSPQEILDRARQLMGQGKQDEAISLLEESVRREPKVAGLEAQLGKAYYQKRDFHQAVIHFEMAARQQPEDGETTQLLGLSFYSLGQWAKAIPYLEKVQSRIPESEIDGPYLLGICYLHTQQPQKARGALARMFSVSPESAMAHLMLAKMMMRERNEEEAIPELQRALNIDPSLPMAHFLLGEIHLFKSNPQLALEEFKKELEVNPTVWLVYWRLGDAYSRLEKYDEAEKALKQSIWLNGTFTGSYILLGQIELKKNDWELAVGFLERALKLDPQNYLAHYSLARAYQQLGRNDEANLHFELSRSLRGNKKSEEEQLFQQIPR